MRLPRLVAAVALFASAALPPAIASAGSSSNPSVGSVAASFDMNYVYSLMDDTNNSTNLNDGKSWLVRYYRRLSGAAGETQATNASPCLLDPSTGKNVASLGGTNGDTNGPNSGSRTQQDCWWEFMNAWKATAAGQPGMSAGNVTDHVYHLGEVDSNPYVSNPQSLTTKQPGPQDTVMLTIPGAVHPDETVVIGEHPDGVSSSWFGSAYDDGQGAAVIMGVARAMLQYWTSHHEWPARTVQFVLFDGEEEGLFGSFYYQANEMPVGAVDNNQYAAMFNVDQNGFEYPARHVGTQDKPDQGPWFTNIYEAPESNYSFYTDKTTHQPYPRLVSNHDAIAAFHATTHQAVLDTFNQLGAVYKDKPMPLWDYPAGAPYPSGCNTTGEVTCVDTFQNTSDLHYINDVDDTLGRTDQDPFIRCGVPAWGILGAYDGNKQEPVETGQSVPAPGYAGYDTNRDNIGWLNWFASGKLPPTGADISPQNEIDPSKLGTEALRRALTFAGQLVLNEAGESQFAGSAPMPTYPVAYFQADRYTAKVGDLRTFEAIPSPTEVSAYNWSFDDGTQATGASVSHAFATAGVHTVTLHATGPGGTSTYSASINVVNGDANTPCGEVGPGNSDVAYAPTFTAESIGTAVPESPHTVLLAVAGGAAIGALVAAQARRRRRRFTSPR